MKNKLCKKRNGAIFSGVLNGIADYCGIDVSLVRIIYVIAGIVLGCGLLFFILYLIMDWIIPDESEVGFDDYKVE